MDIRDIIRTNDEVIRRAIEEIRREDVSRVAIFNGSSFHELPLDTALKLPPLAEGRVFEIEERSEYVSKDSLNYILRLMRPKEVVVRVGFEVWDEGIREGYLRKGMPNSEVMRLANLRKEVKEEGLPIKFIIYVLFGMKGIPEDKVIESVIKFKELFDGVIAIKYRKYLPNHPDEAPVSKELAKFLEENTDLVDWGEEGEWVITQ